MLTKVSRRAPLGIQSLLALFFAFGSLAGSLWGAANARYGQIPLTFIENRGQTHPSVRFLAKGPGMTAYFTAEEIAVDLHSTVVRMRYPGAAPAAQIGGLDRQEGRAHFFIGADPAKWTTDAPMYGKVVYRELWPGIDMVFSARARWLKSEFVVAAGADPSRIRIQYDGVQSVRTDDNGRLILATAGGELREEAPEIYQESGGARVPVTGAFRVSGAEVFFDLGDYDHGRELRIDPVLSYSTYLGGSGTDKGNAIAVDSAGAAYVTGYTDSSDYPVVGALQSATGGSVDVFVTKLNAAGNAIVYSTYLGGGGDDRGYSIAVDGSGSAYVTGWTSSSNFPLASPLMTTLAGARNAFVSKLNAAGSALVYSTYLGGAGTDSGNGIAVDSSNAAYVTGSTTSSNFPTAVPEQAAPGGGSDAFVTKLNATGSAMVYSTYLGGAGADSGSSIAVDSTGAAYIAGTTSSTNFPTVAPLQASNGGGPDAFVAKLSPGGAQLVYSTYLGGSGTENVELGKSIAVDSSGSAYVVGTTNSSNFPTLQPLQAALNGSQDAFAAKLNPAGTALVYSTYLGGSSIDFGESIAVDGSGYAYLAGYTASSDFPVVNGDQPANGGGYDAFVVKLGPSGSGIAESDLLGGSGNDAAYGIALDSAGSAYVAGQTLSFNFPLVTPVQSSLGNTLAAFVAKFTFGANTPPAAVSVTPPGGSGAIQTFTLLYQDSRAATDLTWVEINWNATQATVAACYLHYIRASNTIELSNDAGSGWIGSAALGAPGVLQNSQCSVNAGASSAFASGNNLTLNLALTFLGAFSGTKNVYMQEQSAAAGLVGWQSRGTWTVTSSPPTNVSVTPSSGSGTAQAFSFVYSDPYGFADVQFVDILFQSQLSAVSACYAIYVPSTNTITLVNDLGSGNAGWAAMGSSSILSNSQCSLNTAFSSVSGSGNNLTLTVALTFSGAFSGTKNIYMVVGGSGAQSSGWQAEGTWTVPALPPTNVSVTPASGSGNAQTFSFVYSSPRGFGDINYFDILLQSQLSAANACYAIYVASSNTITLQNDAGNGGAGTATLGTAGALSNSQCSINTGSSSVSGSGINLTFTVSITFTPAFAGPKNIYMVAGNSSGLSSGWQAKGTWTVGVAPVNVSVTPSSGSGISQVFSFVYSTSRGFSDFTFADVLFQTQFVASNACYAIYVSSSNTISLVSDSGSGYAGSATLGTAGTLSNSQCSINTGASSASGSGNNLTLTLSVTFNPVFSGAKSVFMVAGNTSTLTSGWQAMGTWTP